MDNQVARFKWEIKSVDDEKRVIYGVATTVRKDRVLDVVEPTGLTFADSVPLLLNHESEQPVGRAYLQSPTSNGVAFRAEIPKVIEPGLLRDEVDRAWQLVKYKLIDAVSIGFKPIRDKVEVLKGGGLRFLEAEIFELSLVPVGANPDAMITSFKSMQSADRALLSASGQRQQTVVRLVNSPGATGIQSCPKGESHMATITEQISGLEAKRAADAGRMEAIMQKTLDEGRSTDDAEAEEFDTLQREVEKIDTDLVRLKALEKVAIAKATPITRQSVDAPEKASAIRANQPSGIISVGTRLEPGQKMARFALALKRARGNLNDALSICQNNKAWMDTSPEVAMVLKAAVAAGDTTTAGWASELVYAQNLANEFIEYLRPMTIIGKIPNFRRVPFNVRMGSQTAGSTGYWVGQGLPVPVSKLTTSSQSLAIMKAAGLVTLDDELVRSSSPAAELLVRDDLSAAVVQLLDVTLIDPNVGGVANVSPSSLTYGVTPITASGTDYAAIKTDVKAAFAPAIAVNMPVRGAVWVMSETTALALSLMQNALGQDQFPGISINGGTWFGMPVITSQYAAITGSPQFGNIIVLIYPQEVFLADDGQVTISISNEASIQMLDNPTNQSTGATVATTMVSMFQTNSEAIKAVRYITWSKRRTAAAAFIQATAYA